MTKNVRPVQFGRKNPFIIQNKSKIMTHYNYPFENGIIVELVIMLGGDYAFVRVRDYCGYNHIDKDQFQISEMEPLKELLDWAGYYEDRFDKCGRPDLREEFKARYGKQIIKRRNKHEN